MLHVDNKKNKQVFKKCLFKCVTRPIWPVLWYFATLRTFKFIPINILTARHVRGRPAASFSSGSTIPSWRIKFHLPPTNVPVLTALHVRGRPAASFSSWSTMASWRIPPSNKCTGTYGPAREGQTGGVIFVRVHHAQLHSELALGVGYDGEGEVLFTSVVQDVL